MANPAAVSCGIMMLEAGAKDTDMAVSSARAFLEQQAGQCGYCLSGIIISAKALLDRNPIPSRADIVTALDKHLCRCGTHMRIIAAVQKAAGAPA